MDNMVHSANIVIASILGLALLALSGCGDESLQLEPVSGSITVDGKPVVVGSIQFCPARGNTYEHELAGMLDKTGHYRVYCQEREGVPLGWYKVVVFAHKGLAMPPVSLIGTHYNSEGTTPLAIEVVKNPSPGTYDLKLTGVNANGR